MGLIMFDGFDYYDGSLSGNAQLSQRYTVDQYCNIDTGRFGGKSLKMTTASSSWCIYTFGANTDTLTFGVAMLTWDMSSGTFPYQMLLLLDASDAVVLRFGFTQNGQLLVGRGDFTTNLIQQSDTGLFAYRNWFYLEGVITRHATAGSIQCWINGVKVIDQSNVNTGANPFRKFRMQTDSASGSGRGLYDDLYIYDTAARVGERRVQTLVPSADTAQKDFARSTGSTNWSLVDELPFNADTDYVSSGNVGDKDLYEFTDLSGVPAVIDAVQVVKSVRKDDATTRTVRANLKSGSTLVNGAAVAVSANYQATVDTYTQDPNTLAAWTAAAVNALQAGPEVVS